MFEFLADLASRSSLKRATAAEAVGPAAEAKLRALLTDASPYVYGAKPVIGEVRFAALEALQAIFYAARRVPDFGPVVVRRPMPVEDADWRAGQLSAEERRRVAEAVEQTLRTRIVPTPQHEPALRAYSLLQALGQIEYRDDAVDPRTYATALQEEVRQAQVAKPRPRPHLRIADGDDASRTFGYLYRDARGIWAIDFAEGIGPRAAREHLTNVLSALPDDEVDVLGAALAGLGDRFAGELVGV